MKANRWIFLNPLFSKDRQAVTVLLFQAQPRKET